MQNGIQRHFAGEATDKNKTAPTGAFMNGAPGDSTSMVNDFSKILSGEGVIGETPKTIMKRRVGRASRATGAPWYFIDQIAARG